MSSVSVYRKLLRLYPALHREQFGEEMIAVFGEMQAETAAKSKLDRGHVFSPRDCWSRGRGAAGTLASIGWRFDRAVVSTKEVYDAYRISFSERQRPC